MAMKNIKYTYNWNNKLSTKCHTTLRLRNDEKYKVGEVYNEVGPNGTNGPAKIVAIKHIRIDQINEFIARLDTGYSAAECKTLIYTMYKNKRIDWSQQQLSFILLERTKPAQQTIKL